MRYGLLASMIALFLAMHALATPAQDPSALLDIGPPPEGKNVEEYQKGEIDNLTATWGWMVGAAWRDPEVRKLPSVVALRDPRPWLSKNLRAVPEVGTPTFLRLKFRAGNRTEQVTILNAVLRAYLNDHVREAIEYQEGVLRMHEAGIPKSIKRIKGGHEQPEMVERLREGIDNARNVYIPARRAEIARLKDIAVIKWAK